MQMLLNKHNENGRLIRVDQDKNTNSVIKKHNLPVGPHIITLSLQLVNFLTIAIMVLIRKLFPVPALPLTVILKGLNV